MIIDVHTHCPPHGGRQAWQTFLDQCRMNGVSLSLVSSLGCWRAFPGRREVRRANDEALAFCRFAAGAAKWLAYLNPQLSDWPDELDRCQAGGAIGVKLWISLKSASGSLRRTEAVIHRAAQQGLPVLIHTFSRTDGNLPGEISVEELLRLAARCPEARLIGAHAGANWRLSLDILRRRMPNVWVDISGSFPERGMVEALVRALGPDRVVFGSDMPGRSVASQLAKVTLATISPRVYRRIFSGNAAELFHLAIPREASGSKALGPPRRSPDAASDHFCFCGSWPLGEMNGVTSRRLSRELAGAGIRQAFAADLNSLFVADLKRANDRYAAGTRGWRRILPLAMLNPGQPDWQATLEAMPRRCAGIWVSPYLHHWRLDDPAHAGFFGECARRHVPLWINTALGDHRFRIATRPCRPVEDAEVLNFARRALTNQYVFQALALPCMRAMLSRYPRDRRFRYDLSRLTDHTGQWREVLDAYGPGRLVFGSEFPVRDIRQVRWTMCCI